MTSVFFVDVWSDIVCPFCYLGRRQLELALAALDAPLEVVVRHHAFELDPRAAEVHPGTLNEMLAHKYGVTPEQAEAMNARVASLAHSLGMQWSLDRARPANTFDAHRLVALAATQGRDADLLERLFRAYFSEGEVVSDHTTLARLADEVGVDGSRDVLSGVAYADEVRHDENLAARIGITGVPAFIFDGRVHVSGAQGVDALLDALRSAIAQRESFVS